MLGSFPIKLLKDINPNGNAFPFQENFGLLPIGDGKALFTAFSGNTAESRELWITDGTLTGTQRVEDVNNPSGIELPKGFALQRPFTSLGNGKALIIVQNDSFQGELWITDGTASSTQRIQGIEPNSNFFGVPFTPIEDGKAIFSIPDENNNWKLWVLDSTGDTTQIENIIPEGTSEPRDFTVIGDGKIVFSVTPRLFAETDLYITDGTIAGTKGLRDINFFNNTEIASLTSLGNGKAVFRANNSIQGSELWITDGTDEGTALLKDINPGRNSSFPSDLALLSNNRVLFTANDGTNGFELWITDGTDEGTTLVKDVVPNGSPLIDARGFTPLGDGNAWFEIEDRNNLSNGEVWITDGTEIGTKPITDVLPSDTSEVKGFSFIKFDDKRSLFTVEKIGGESEVWITDGTESGTKQATDLIPEGVFVSSDFASLGNGKAVFSALDSNSGNELWIFEDTVVNQPDLLATDFDIVNDHMLTGAATLSFSVENKGNQTAGRFTANLVYSDSDIIGDIDDQIIQTFSYESLDAESILSESLTVQLPLITSNQNGLYDRALRDDITGMGSDFVSSSIDYLGVVIDPENTVAEANEFNNSNQGQGEDIDDFTYFPWDVDSNGIVTPTDAIFVINRLGQSSNEINALADFDGNGLITPTDVIASINRLGYAINPAVFEAL